MFRQVAYNFAVKIAAHSFRKTAARFRGKARRFFDEFRLFFVTYFFADVVYLGKHGFFIDYFIVYTGIACAGNKVATHAFVI